MANSNLIFHNLQELTIKKKLSTQINAHENVLKQFLHESVKHEHAPHHPLDRITCWNYKCHSQSQSQSNYMNTSVNLVGSVLISVFLPSSFCFHMHSNIDCSSRYYTSGPFNTIACISSAAKKWQTQKLINRRQCRHTRVDVFMAKAAH